MADDPKPDPDTRDDPAPTPDPDAGAKKALDAERAARREAERKLKDVEAQLQQLADKDKSEVDKLRDDVARLTRERDDHATKAMRLEVATAKGLTPAMAKRLAGSTREELEADADELLADFAPTPGGDDDPKPTLSGRPKERLRGGGDPTDEPEETDPRKLADLVTRR